MKLEALKLIGFRNHAETDIECSETVNLFVGPNGHGKTNILEGIAYLSIGKSFFSVPDSTLLRRGDEYFVLHGRFRSDKGISSSVGIRYSAASGKKEIRIDNNEQDRVSALVGRYPVVLLHPEQHSITNGGPGERRRFIDLVLSQAHAGYFDLLVEYRRILKQRNALLMERRGRNSHLRDALAVWDEQFIKHCIDIADYRRNFVRALGMYLRDNYMRIAGEDEVPLLQYQTEVPCNDDGTGSQRFDDAYDAFRKTFDAELRYGSTVFGPHRDELVLLINNMEVRKFASQGQQKSFLVALKISESQYLLEKRNEQPLILLDDLFGELDRERSRRVLELTSCMGQIFVTSADESIIERQYPSLNGHAKFLVNAGSVLHA